MSWFRGYHLHPPGPKPPLTQAKINVLRFQGINVTPVLLHDQTAATNKSDWNLLQRVRIKGLVTQTLSTEANKYIGEASLSGLLLAAMKTGCDNKLVTLQSRGYITGASLTISTTPAEQRLGHAELDCTFRT